MNSAHKLTLIFTILLLASGISQSHEHDCEWLLRYGIHNTKKVRTSDYSFEHLKTLLETSDATTMKEFTQRAADAGLKIGGFGFSAAASESKEKFSAWKSDFLKTSSFQSIKDQQLQEEIANVSPELMAAVAKCLESKKGLIAKLVPTDDKTFVLQLAFNRREDQKKDANLIRSVTFTPAELIIAPSKDEAKNLASGTALLGEMSATLVRRNPSDTITVTVNTTYESAVLVMPGIKPAAPMKTVAPDVLALEARIKELELESCGARLKYDTRTRLITGQRNIRSVVMLNAIEWKVQFMKPFTANNYVAVASVSDGNCRIISDDPTSLTLQITNTSDMGSGQFSLVVFGQLSP